MKELKALYTSVCLILILGLSVCVNTVDASEITGTLNSNSNLSTGLTGTVAPSPDGTNPVIPAVPVTPLNSGGGGGGGGGGGSLSSTPPARPTLSSYTGPVYTFTKTLKVGDVSSDVKNLQKFLNANNYKITSSGAGSPGKETTSFGTLTKKALIKFQKDEGLPQTGILDVKTIKEIEEITAGDKTDKSTGGGNSTSTKSVVSENATAGGSSTSFNRDLKKGNIGSDVKALQVFLNNNGFKIAKSGVGSPGRENNNFGELTRKALIQFQKSVKIPATGILGPKTRAYLNNI